ncbi:hypothetical protein, partial [Escherichia coli]|uniref:hypothetical protein n=1 Tax=Escherichia coli TaxID=562 RepID=UPI001BFC0E47
TGGTADRNRSHWSTSKTPSYTKSVSWQHHPICESLTTGLILFGISLDGLLFTFSSFGPVVRSPEIHL